MEYNRVMVSSHLQYVHILLFKMVLTRWVSCTILHAGVMPAILGGL